MIEWHATAYLSENADLHLDGALMEGSPVDLLMGAIAGCFVKSCHMVQEARREPKTRVVANVTGRKGDGTPNRVGHVSIRYDLPGLDPEHAARIARDAKRICTVTNAMSCEFEVEPK